jgi:flagellar biosynthesis protein FlhA
MKQATGKSSGFLNKDNWNLSKYADIAFALAITVILLILLFPISTHILDFMLALSITSSILILMTCLFISKPLELSSFPTILLVTAIMRLSLNIASTRLILANGHTGLSAAGEVIRAFGSFVMQGNLVIGVIVFAILTIINFVVITKGSGRIAEVAARFSLDAMPGKQMAIDADLSAGLIDEDTAKKRRKDLEDESTFFGSMDGANKFVRGDAIAGLLITFINFIGGVVIGVVQRDMNFSDALHTYTILTIGDGLVSQIPALVISLAAGLLVSRSGVVGSAEKAIFGQLSHYPQALIVSSLLMALMALMPGIPAIPFFTLSAITGGIAWNIKRGIQKTGGKPKERSERGETTKAEGEKAQDAGGEESISASLKIESVRLELGYSLLSLINYSKGHRLTEQIKAMRKQMAKDLGFIMPAVRIQDNMQLPTNTYVIYVKDIECGRAVIRHDKLMIMDPKGGEIAIEGEDTKEPAFGIAARWIEEDKREEALFYGYTVVDPPTVITTHLTEIVKENITELLSYTETQKLLDEIGDDHRKLVTDTVPNAITVANLQKILQSLLSENVSIRDLPSILEAITEIGKSTTSLITIIEHVRVKLARQISFSCANAENIIPMVVLSTDWEQAFVENLVGSGEDKHLSMSPSRIQEFINECNKIFDELAFQGEAPILLVSPMVRPYVRSIMERFRPLTPVLSQNEIHAKAKIKTICQL